MVVGPSLGNASPSAIRSVFNFPTILFTVGKTNGSYCSGVLFQRCGAPLFERAMWGSRIRWVSFLRSYPSSARSAALVSFQGFSSWPAPSLPQNVGFIGLGNMGFHMAQNLINAGYKLTVHDINDEAAEKFREMGIPTKEKPFEVGESSDVVITMLPSSSSVMEVYTGTDGLLNMKQPTRPRLFIDCSTVDTNTSRTISNQVSRQTLRECFGDIENPLMLDAPVSGGVPGAESGTLTFMVGGSEEALKVAKPLFQTMGKRIIYCGGPGNGTAAKICNNLAMAVSMVGISEALALGQRLGISATTLTDVFNSSSARCWSSEIYNPVPGVLMSTPSSKNYAGGFSSKLMAKDLDLAVSSASGVELRCPLAVKALQIYEELCNGGHEAEDFSCVFRHHYFGRDETPL
ncbi:6-phosphogluconate dehydrogenase family protein isoform X2 [Wolffia australiana]